MPNNLSIDELHEQMRQWRHHLHQYPETAFEETATSQFIAELLKGFGLEVHQGLGKTGVVATLSAGTSNKKIALRADMDALWIQEENTFAHKSRNHGIMHACGHDGHTAMLLGAAHHLTANRNFDGTVYFIFQPAEEGLAGAKKMIDDGLFKLFPANCIFGMHNFHDIPVGHFAIKSGPMMASSDAFEITLRGRGTHAAIPHLGNDVILAAAQLITALQSISSRIIDPADPVVISITQIHAGNTWNALPETVLLRGTFRCFNPKVQVAITTKIQQLLDGIGHAFNVTPKLVFNPNNPGYPVTSNTNAETQLAIQAATTVVGTDKVILGPNPSMGAEDFAFMLQEKPGCYVWIGNGSSQNGCLLHNPNYDFNDQILTTGANYWIELVKLVLQT